MEIHAHRAVLASASPYLFELFTADQDKNQQRLENIITYKLNGGFDQNALQILIDYAYTAKLTVKYTQVIINQDSILDKCSTLIQYK